MYMLLLPLKEPCLLFKMLMRLCDFIIDDSESEINHEERADEDHKYKVDEGAWMGRVHCHSHHERPAL
jgi:hypothetical protein